MRAAIYFTPPAGHPLTRTAGVWLGRSAFDGEPTRSAEPSIDGRVAVPARYGFHATMKAPFALAEGTTLTDLDARLARFCAWQRPVTIERLALSHNGGFFALVPEASPPALSELAAEIVRSFEPFRAPLNRADVARRKPESLSERQRRNLWEWGYPYVFSEFHFHMTLTEAVPTAETEKVEAMLRQRFSPFYGEPLAIDALALFVEPWAGAPLKVHSRHPFAAV